METEVGELGFDFLAMRDVPCQSDDFDRPLFRRMHGRVDFQPQGMTIFMVRIDFKNPVNRLRGLGFHRHHIVIELIHQARKSHRLKHLIKRHRQNFAWLNTAQFSHGRTHVHDTHRINCHHPDNI